MCIRDRFWAESFVLPSCPMHRDMVQHGSHGGHDAPDQQPTTDCDCLGSCVSSDGVGLAKAPFVLDLATPHAWKVAVGRAVRLAQMCIRDRNNAAPSAASGESKTALYFPVTRSVQLKSNCPWTRGASCALAACATEGTPTAPRTLEPPSQLRNRRREDMRRCVGWS